MTTEEQIKELQEQVSSLIEKVIREAEDEPIGGDEGGDTNLPTTKKSKRATVSYGLPDKKEWNITKLIGKDRGVELVIFAGRMKDQPDKQVINGYIRFMDIVPDKPIQKSQFAKGLEKLFVATFLMKFVRKFTN